MCHHAVCSIGNGRIVAGDHAVCSIGNGRIVTGDHAVCTFCLWHNSCEIIIAGNFAFIHCVQCWKWQNMKTMVLCVPAVGSTTVV